MQGPEFDQRSFFDAIDGCGARALLIGRQALIALGLPLLTSHYDYWLHIDDVAVFNRAVEAFGLLANHPAEEARKRGRYVLENDERVDVLVSRSRTTIDGTVLTFEDAWARRQRLELGGGCGLWLPCLDDLIVTKRFAARPKDAEDIRLLELLRRNGAK